MTLPVTKAQIPNVVREAMGSAGRLKNTGESLVAASLAGPTARALYANYLAMLKNTIDACTLAAATTGAEAIARDMYDEPLTDFNTDWTALVTACEDLRDWIMLTYPQSGGGRITQTFDQDGVYSDLTFSSAALADFRTNVAVVLALMS